MKNYDDFFELLENFDGKNFAVNNTKFYDIDVLFQGKSFFME